ncbi:MAG: sulfite exporter TauE/SafE family protein [Bacteroidetes bacterium]|nr:sulfite exporter TauE/SafE family protein [Bacteroidota bacterium]
MIEIIGYIFAVIMGLVLGLIGGGGSILTVPILVYLFGVSPVTSTSYSLIIVGVTSLAGVAVYVKSKNISYSTGIYFAIPALITVYITRRYILPAIPDEIFSLESFILTKDVFIMVLFASLMVFSSFGMIKNKKFNFNSHADTPGKRIFLIASEGIIVGILTGLVGAGGGFLIIPALVLFADLPMKLAVGTSLFIISIKSLIGFAGDIGADVHIDWMFLMIFTSISIAGMILGTVFAKNINSKILKPVFGWFVLVTGTFIILQNIFNIGAK